jgi:acetyl/propionyl-CoA carboxylase alpha subunit
MIAKVIVSGQSREEVLLRMKRALQEFVIEGIKTTIPFHIKLMDDPGFKSGKFTTAFMDTFDLNICRMVIMGNYDNELYFYKNHLSLKEIIEIKEKKMYIINPLYPANLERRIQKFLDRGFTWIDSNTKEELTRYKYYPGEISAYIHAVFDNSVITYEQFIENKKKPVKKVVEEPVKKPVKKVVVSESDSEDEKPVKKPVKKVVVSESESEESSELDELSELEEELRLLHDSPPNK